MVNAHAERHPMPLDAENEKEEERRKHSLAKKHLRRTKEIEKVAQIVSDVLTMMDLVSHLHFENLNTASSQRWCSGSRSRGHGILVADESLRMEFESFAHELGDSVLD